MTSKEEYEALRLRERPPRAVLEVLRGTPTAVISDALKRLGIVNFKLRGVRPVVPLADSSQRMVGRAITLGFAPINGAYPLGEAKYQLAEMIEQAEEDDVVVIAGQGAPYGFWGDQVTHFSVKNRLAGAVIDGFTRDSEEIRDRNFRVFSTGVTFEAFSGKYEGITFNAPIVCAEAMVRPGDVMVGDEDGVLVVPREVLERLVSEIAIVRVRERKLTDLVDAGTPWSEIYNELDG